VLVPFAAVFLVDAVSTRWSAASQSALHAVMVLLALASLVVYGAELVRPHTPPAFTFVVVPPASLLLMAFVFAAAAVVAHRRLRKG
jgi:cell shape-determining protein MreD